MTEESFDHTTGEIVTRPALPARAPRYESEQTGQFAEALAKAQGAMEAPNRTKEGTIKGTTKGGTPYEYKYKYAPFEEVKRVLKPLAEHGIAYHQGLVSRGGEYFVRTFLRHASSGEFIASDYPVFPDRPGMQGFAGAVTYAKRNGLCLALGLAPEDDDDGVELVGDQQSTQTNRANRATPTRANPAVAEPSSTRQLADEAWKKIADAIDIASDRIAMLGIYDESNGSWGKRFETEIRLISPESLKLLQTRATKRLTDLAQATAQKVSPPKRPPGRPPKAPPSDLGLEPPDPKVVAAIAKKLESGISPEQIAAEQKAKHRAELIRMAREAALTSGRQGLRRYSRALAEADYNDNTAEWEDIRDEVVETLLPIADRFDQGKLEEQEKADSEKLLAVLAERPRGNEPELGV